MSVSKNDLSIFNKLKFPRPPVGVKFLYEKPEGIQRLKEKRTFCAMLPEAHKGEAFYATKEDHLCEGTFTLGQTDIPPVFGSGAIVAAVGRVDQLRAGTEVYRTLPRLEKGTINYVVFSPLDKLTFDPDVLVLTATLEQANLLMIASTYTNGKLWTSKTSTVLGCGWLFVYPYISGEINYMVMGICAAGMVAKKLLPAGLVMISIPYQQLPTVINNLKIMPWEPMKDIPKGASKEVVEALKYLAEGMDEVK
jgi:uncharacterized protein (DUF169 family)